MFNEIYILIINDFKLLLLRIVINIISNNIKYKFIKL